MIIKRLKDINWMNRLLLLLVIIAGVMSIVIVTTFHTGLFKSYESRIHELGYGAVNSAYLQVDHKARMLEITADSMVENNKYQFLLDVLIENGVFETVVFYNHTNGESYIKSIKNQESEFWLNTAYLMAPQDNMEQALYLSTPVMHTEYTEYYNLFYYPILDSEQNKVGYLVGYIPTQSLYETFSNNTQDKNYEIAILSNNGTIIVASQKDDGMLPLGEKVFSFLDADTKLLDEIRIDFSGVHVSKNNRVKIHGSEYYFYYDTVDENNQVYAVFFEESLITGSANTLFYLFISIVVVLFGFLCFFLIINVRQYLNSLKQMDSLRMDLHSLAYIDPVTDHMNWNGFIAKVTSLLTNQGVNYALVSMDIDKFRTTNDFLGHKTGDLILHQLADILGRNLDENEAFTRNNADLFYLLLSYKTDDDLYYKVNSIINDADYQITDFNIILSFGIYKITSRMFTLRSIVDRADLARKTIKHRTESSFAFFDNNMLSQAREEKAIENDMEEALEKGEFHIYLQPKYDLKNTNHIIGAEALVRWFRDSEMLSPGKFIPLFERNRFILKLDLYVFEEVCKQQKKWMSQGKDVCVLSVNMSRVHLEDADFVQKLSNICKKYNIPPHYFEIEITESAANENLEMLSNVFQELKKEGFHISIDDFGAGYSSLNMLKDLPVDILKIDRSFLTDAETNKRAQEIVSHVVSLALALQMQTICEGLETKEQVELVKRVGCQMAQGYFFARPMPITDYEKLAFQTEVRN